MSDPDVSGLAKLREAFPAGKIGKLPKTSCRDCSSSNSGACQQHSKQRCDECGAYMTTAHIHVDFVGHADVTDRLLEVDPLWMWEPVAWTPEGDPLIRWQGKRGSMWIWLTVCGVRRLGVGTAAGGTEVEKELIGDAIRNAAMRFGVALSLWSKSEHSDGANDDLTPPERDPAEVAVERGWESLPQYNAVVKDLQRRSAALPEEQRDELRAFLQVQGLAPSTLTAEQSEVWESTLVDFEQAG